MKKRRPILPLFLTLLLTATSLLSPSDRLEANEKAGSDLFQLYQKLPFSKEEKTPILGGPSITSFSIQDNEYEVYSLNEGDIPYSLQVDSGDVTKRALLTFTLENTDTEARKKNKKNKITVLNREHVEDQVFYKGTIPSVEKGIWKATLETEDEAGNPGKTKVLWLEVGYPIPLTLNQDQLILQKEGENKEIVATLTNPTDRPKRVKVGGKWEEEGKWQTAEVQLPGQKGAQVQITYQMGNIQMEGKAVRSFEFAAEPIQYREEYLSFAAVTVQLGYSDLLVKNMKITNVGEGGRLKGEVLVENVALEERAAQEATKVRISRNGAGANQNVTLNNGESKTVFFDYDVFSLTYPLELEAVVNPDRDRPINEMAWDNNRYTLTIEELEFLNFFAEPGCTFSNFEAGQTADITFTFGLATGSSDEYLTHVEFRNADTGAVLDTREFAINFQSDEDSGGDTSNIKQVTFQFDIPANAGGNTYHFEAEINTAHDPQEVTYDDNLASCSEVVQEPWTPPNCTVTSNPSRISGLHEECTKYEENCHTHTDGREHCPKVCVETKWFKYWEKIELKMEVEPTPNPVKAGMGFFFKVKSSYTNSNPHGGDNHDFPAVSATFNDNPFLAFDASDPDTYNELQLLPEEVVTPTTDTPSGREWNKWYHPRAKIMRGQGDANMITYLPQKTPIDAPVATLPTWQPVIDPMDATKTYIDGGNKHYTSFYFKDTNASGGRPFSFTVQAQGAGSHIYTVDPYNGSLEESVVSSTLSYCFAKEVNIQGSPQEDYGLRRVNPNVPFPDNHKSGWNWKAPDGSSLEHDLTGDVADWFDHYGEGSSLSTDSISLP